MNTFDADTDDLVDRIFNWGSTHWDIHEPGRLLVVCPTRQIAAAVMLGTVEMQEPMVWNARTYDVRYYGFVVSFIGWAPGCAGYRGVSWQHALYHAKTSPDAYYAIEPGVQKIPTDAEIADYRKHMIETWTL